MCVVIIHVHMYVGVIYNDSVVQLALACYSVGRIVLSSYCALFHLYIYILTLSSLSLSLQRYGVRLIRFGQFA